MLNQKQFQLLETFFMYDQPFTCPYCGSCCEEIASFYHTNAKTTIEKCLNEDCGFTCFQVVDEEMLTLWGK